jgi:DNA-binding transcriptional LysR family regulator
MNYTLHQLEIFKKLTELKSVTRVSESLYLSQPAISIQLKNFQNQFSQPLFEVIGRQVFITDFGKEIGIAANKILVEVELINYKSSQFEGKIAGKLKIAIVSTAKYAMPYFLTDFINKNDAVDLIMDVTNKANVLKSLENNEVDFAMVSTLPKNMNIERIELMKNKLFLVGPSNYINANKSLQKRELEKLSFIYRENGSATRIAMQNYIETQNIRISKKIELTSNEAIKQAVVAGLGFSIMPLIGIKSSLQSNELKIFKTKGLPIETNWNLIWLKSKKNNTVTKAFIEHMNKDKDDIINNKFGWFEDY